MAYIGNIVAFWRPVWQLIKSMVCITMSMPDLTMNELVSQVRTKLKGKSGVGPRLPYWLGIILGYTADIAKLRGEIYL